MSLRSASIRAFIVFRRLLIPLATIAITLTTTAVTPIPVPMMDAIMLVSFILLCTIPRASHMRSPMAA